MLSKKSFIFPLLFCASPLVHSADWVMIQSTEDEGSTKRAKVFGMLQVNYKTTANSELKFGPGLNKDAVFNQVNPERSVNSGFEVKNAYIGIRGAGFVLDKRINYLVAFDAGKNGLTLNNGASLADASITYRPSKSYGFRFGQMKTPTATEGLASPATQVFNNHDFFSQIIGKEKFINPDDTSEITTSAYRDIGLQFFGNFKTSDQWEHTYALMLGNGSITRTEQTDGEDFYAKWSSFYLLNKGRKGFRQDMEITGWLHTGKRIGLTSNESYGIDRYGIAINYLHNQLRFNASANVANGKILHGTTGGMKPGESYGTGQTAGYIETDKGKATGFAVALGYKITPNTEVVARYDNLDREGTQPSQSKLFERLTFGTAYRFNPKTHIVANYEIKRGSSDTDSTDAILESMDNELSVEMKHLF